MKTDITRLIDNLNEENIVKILEADSADYLFEIVRTRFHYKKIRVVPILEISNNCDKNCLYCGIRRDSEVKRYSMTIDEILNECKKLRNLGFYHIHIQAGDSLELRRQIISIVRRIHGETGMTVALSIGPLDENEIIELEHYGLRGILIRFETSNRELFDKINPEKDFDSIISTINFAKKHGLKIATGFQIGLPGEDMITLAKDILFTTSLDASVIGVGPFIPTLGTPFQDKNRPFGFDVAERVVSLLRLLNKDALIPATTAYDAIVEKGVDLSQLPNRSRLLHEAGANIIMLSVTPQKYRDQYFLYTNKDKVI